LKVGTRAFGNDRPACAPAFLPDSNGFLGSYPRKIYTEKLTCIYPADQSP
jgi:hypothetical protein